MKYMDLLFKRYASPFLLVDQMISVGQFADFVVQLVEQDSDYALWDFFLHKIDGKSFNDWKASLGMTTTEPEVTDEQIGETINSSFEILNSFEPDY